MIRDLRSRCKTKYEIGEPTIIYSPNYDPDRGPTHYSPLTTNDLWWHKAQSRLDR
jgi:hypothetical protein